MELKQLEYIVKIAEEHNITRAADKLFMTQSALNQQLLKLERELGTPLFYRSRTDCQATEAGQIYVNAAREILKIKKNTYNKIYDLVSIKQGVLSIGFTPNRGTTMFSTVYPQFHQSYPQVLVEPMELNVKSQMEKLANGDLDVGFLTLLKNQQKPSLEYHHICTEEIFLAVPSRNPICSHTTARDGRLPELDLALVREEPFVLMYKQSTIRGLIDSLFNESNFKPHVLFETSSTNTILTMIESNLCCGLIPEYYVDLSNKNISYFSLPQHPTWEIAACCKKGHYNSKATKTFIGLAADYWGH